MISPTSFAALLVPGALGMPAAEPPRPLEVLLVTGGGYHDYAAQKDIVKAGLEARANVRVTQAHVDTDARDTRPAIPIHGKPDYARGYDMIIHDQCAAEISDPAVIDGVLQPHRDGVPAVVLHCAVHSYRIGDPADAVEGPGTPRSPWFEFVGVQSSGHGPEEPISITSLEPENPIVRGLHEWTTGNEELYNNVKVFDTVHPLARGRQGSDEALVAWTNLYGDTRVFVTTLGHHNETVADPRYLDLVTRGLLWAAGKLGEDGHPLEGYGPPAGPKAAAP